MLPRHAISLVLIAGLAGTTSCSVLVGKDCTENVERSTSIPSPAAPAVQFRIDRCHLDVDACRDLCQLVLDNNGDFGAPASCDVTFEGDTTNVKTSFTQFNGGPNCPVEEPVPTDCPNC